MKRRIETSCVGVGPLGENLRILPESGFFYGEKIFG